LNTIKNRSRSFHKRWSVTRYYVDTVQAMVSDTVLCWHCPSDGQWHGIMLTLSKRWTVTRFYVGPVVSEKMFCKQLLADKDLSV